MSVPLLWVLLQGLSAPSTPPSPTAQSLANTELKRDSAVRTHDPVEALEARVAELGDRWLREEAEQAQRLPLEARAARFLAILVSAHARHLPATERDLEALAQPTLEAWLKHTGEAFPPRQSLRAVAQRRAMVDALPPGSPLRSLGEDLEARAADWLAGLRSSMPGEGEAFARAHADGLRKGQHPPLPESLARTRNAEGVPTATGACLQAIPSFSPERGVPATQRLVLSSCEEGRTDTVESRVAHWQHPKTILVDKDETYVTEEMERFTSFQSQEFCTDFETRDEHGTLMSSNRRCYTAPVAVEAQRLVKVEHVRTIQVPQTITVEEDEPYRVQVRTYRAAVTVQSTIDGDGQHQAREERLEVTRREEEYASEHGGSSKFTGSAQAEATAALPQAVARFHAQVRSLWLEARGEAALAQASDLDSLVRAAVLLGRVPPPLTRRLDQALGLTAPEAAQLLGQTSVLTPGQAPQGPALALPPPDASLADDLKTYERVIATSEDQQGRFGGLQLGVVTTEKRGGSYQPGFGGLVIGGYRPDFSMRSIVLARVVGQLQVGAGNKLLLDAHLRAELGLQLGPLIFAGVGMGQVIGSAFEDDGPGSREDPITPALGYGARLQFAPALFQASFESGQAVVGAGIELIATRMHRRSASQPHGTNAQATLFCDLGHIVKLTLSVRATTRDDVQDFVSSPTQRWFAGLGIQSEF
jgi:hypothetical protein